MTRYNLDRTQIPPRKPRTAYILGGVRRNGTRCENCNTTYYTCSKQLWEKLPSMPCCEECSMEDMHDVPSLAEIRQLEQARQDQLDSDWLVQHSQFAASQQGRPENDDGIVPVSPDRQRRERAHLERQVDILRTRLTKVKAYLKYVEGRQRGAPDFAVTVRTPIKRTDPEVRNLRRRANDRSKVRRSQRLLDALSSYGPDYF